MKWQIPEKTCKLLGVEHPHDVKTVIERGNVVLAGKHLESIATDLNENFGLRVQVCRNIYEDGSVRRGVELTNAVLRSWGFTVLKTTRKVKRVGGKRVDVGHFHLQYHDNLSQFLTTFGESECPDFLSNEDEDHL